MEYLPQMPYFLASWNRGMQVLRGFILLMENNSYSSAPLSLHLPIARGIKPYGRSHIYIIIILDPGNMDVWVCCGVWPLRCSCRYRSVGTPDALYLVVSGFDRGDFPRYSANFACSTIICPNHYFGWYAASRRWKSLRGVLLLARAFIRTVTHWPCARMCFRKRQAQQFIYGLLQQEVSKMFFSFVRTVVFGYAGLSIECLNTNSRNIPDLMPRAMRA